MHVPSMEKPECGYAISRFKRIEEAPPKVLLVLEASGGGSGRHVVELAHGLLQCGCEVHVIYAKLRADRFFLDGLAALRRVRTREVPMRREPHWSDIACLWQIRRYIGEAGPFDVIHAHSSKAGALARLAAIGTHAARVYTLHAMRTMDPTLHPALRAFYRAVEVGLALTSCEALIAVSKREREHFLEQGIPAAMTYTVANGIPSPPMRDRNVVRAALGLGHEDVSIGFIGRLVPQKAPELFLASIAAAVRRSPSLRGVLVGTGPLQAAVHAMARQEGIFDRVVWVTEQRGQDVLPALDVLVMSSLYEGMPYVLLEALAAGVPVIATDVGGVAEGIDDGVTGFTVPQPDARMLQDKIALLIERPELRQKMAVASRRKSRPLCVKRMVEQTLQIYRAALRTPQLRKMSQPVGLAARRAS
jgi:glycosyltransferase involved in cell wall biosynthesis